jgi:cell division septum initiation protein DivIVA
LLHFGQKGLAGRDHKTSSTSAKPVQAIKRFDGVAQNCKQAAQLKIRAANQGNARAQYVLSGLLYDAGEGVPQEKRVVE